jgi:hypothetical protein
VGEKTRRNLAERLRRHASNKCLDLLILVIEDSDHIDYELTDTEVIQADDLDDPPWDDIPDVAVIMNLEDRIKLMRAAHL